MTPTEAVSISQVSELLAAKGYEVTGHGEGILHVRDVETGVTFQAALQGSVLFLSVTLMTCPNADITPDVMRKMLSAHNGISTSAFQLYDAGDGKTAVALNNFCTLQNMGPEDHDDILSLAGYLMADVIEARDLLIPKAAAH
jgi:hypothetical protein